MVSHRKVAVSVGYRRRKETVAFSVVDETSAADETDAQPKSKPKTATFITCSKSHYNLFYLSIKSATMREPAITGGKPPPGWVLAPTK